MDGDNINFLAGGQPTAGQAELLFSRIAFLAWIVNKNLLLRVKLFHSGILECDLVFGQNGGPTDKIINDARESVVCEVTVVADIQGRGAGPEPAIDIVMDHDLIDVELVRAPV